MTLLMKKHFDSRKLNIGAQSSPQTPKSHDHNDWQIHKTEYIQWTGGSVADPDKV